MLDSRWVRITPHQPHRGTARNADLFQHSKAKALIEGQVLRLLCLEVCRLNFSVALRQYRLKECSAEAVSLKAGIDAEKSQIPMRF
ncbi:unannotated protein [freshwater metagenome]|uniref:Unannotated protein n=1 Tax=freshwater metagenome TaxID=449393 RepID=A0A6J6EWY6_9ZZZZ